MTTEAINKMYPVKLLVALVEDQEEYRKIALDVLHANHLYNVDEQSDPIEYKEKFDANPFLIPHIAMFDLRLQSSLDGMDLTRMVMERGRKLRLKPKVIMSTGGETSALIKKFLRLGGFDWINKNDFDYKEQLKQSLQVAIVDMLEALEDKAALQELKKETILEQYESEVDDGNIHS